MPPQGMLRRKQRVIEVILDRSAHRQLFHHPAGAEIWRYGEGDDFRKAQPDKPIAKGSLSALRCIAPTPMLSPKPPADLHAGGKMRHKPRDRQPERADESRVGAKLDRPETEPMLVEVRPVAGHRGGALVSRERGGKILHHSRIGIH